MLTANLNNAGGTTVPYFCGFCSEHSALKGTPPTRTDTNISVILNRKLFPLGSWLRRKQYLWMAQVWMRVICPFSFKLLSPHWELCRWELCRVTTKNNKFFTSRIEIFPIDCVKSVAYCLFSLSVWPILVYCIGKHLIHLVGTHIFIHLLHSQFTNSNAPHKSYT